MCEHGTTITLSVPIPAADVDSCIADLVASLNAGGVVAQPPQTCPTPDASMCRCPSHLAGGTCWRFPTDPKEAKP